MKNSLCSVLMVSFFLSVNLIIAQGKAADPCSGLKPPEEIDAELAQLGKLSNDNKAEWERLLREKFDYVDCLLSNQELEEAEQYLESTEELLRGRSDILPSTQVLYYAYLGRIQQMNNNIEEALSTYQKAEAIIDEGSTEINNKGKSHVYKYIGTAYTAKSDYYQALKYFEHGLKILDRNPEYREERIAMLSMIGKTISHTDREFDLPQYFQQAIRIAKKIQLREQRLRKITQIKLDFAAALIEIEQYDQAFLMVKEAISLADRIFSKSPREMKNTYEKAIRIYIYAGKYETAVKYIQKNINLYKKINGNDRIGLAGKYSILARCYMYINDFDEAKRYLNKAEKGYSVNINKEKPLERSDVPKRDYVHNYLFTKTLTHLRAYEKTKDITELHTAIPYNELAINTMEEIFSEIESYASKAYFIDRYHAHFEIAVWTRYYLYAETDSLKYLDQAYNFAERSKAMLLKASVGQAGAEQVFALPKDLSERWKRLKAQVVELEQDLYQREQSGEGGTIGLKEKIARTNRAAYLLEDSLRQQYPDHFKLHYVPEPLTTAEIQRNLLKEDEAIVHYFVGRFRMYIFTFTKDNATMTEVEVHLR